MNSSIHHIAINVANVSTAVNWYKTSFDCEVVYQHPNEARLKFENIFLDLLLPSKQPKHIGIQREDAETLGELREQAGGEMTTMIADPTGNIVEIIKGE